MRTHSQSSSITAARTTMGKSNVNGFYIKYNINIYICIEFSIVLFFLVEVAVRCGRCVDALNIGCVCLFTLSHFPADSLHVGKGLRLSVLYSCARVCEICTTNDILSSFTSKCKMPLLILYHFSFIFVFCGCRKIFEGQYEGFFQAFKFNVYTMWVNVCMAV